MFSQKHVDTYAALIFLHLLLCAMGFMLGHVAILMRCYIHQNLVNIGERLVKFWKCLNSYTLVDFSVVVVVGCSLLRSKFLNGRLIKPLDSVPLLDSSRTTVENISKKISPLMILFLFELKWKFEIVLFDRNIVCYFYHSDPK